MPDIVAGLRKAESMFGGFLGLPGVREEIGLEGGVGRILGIGGDRDLPAPVAVNVVPKGFDLIQCSRGGNHITPFASSRRHWSWRPVFLQQHAFEFLGPSLVFERFFSQGRKSCPYSFGCLWSPINHHEVVSSSV